MVILVDIIVRALLTTFRILFKTLLLFWPRIWHTSFTLTIQRRPLLCRNPSNTNAIQSIDGRSQDSQICHQVPCFNNIALLSCCSNFMNAWHQKQLDLTYKWAPTRRTNTCKITITASHLAMETITSQSLLNLRPR